MDTQWDKELADTEAMLDSLSSEYENWMNARLDNEDALLQGIIDKIASQGDAINATLTEIANKYGTTVSDTLITSVGGNTNSAINDFVNGIMGIVGITSIGNVGGYASGTSFAKKGLYWTQEDGQELIIRKTDGAILTPLGSGDMVFNNESSKRLYEIAQNPSAYLAKYGLGSVTPQININTPTLSNIERNNNMTPANINVDTIEWVFPNVTNYTEFKNELIRDKSFEKAMFTMMGNRMTGGNSLSKLKHL